MFVSMSPNLLSVCRKSIFILLSRVMTVKTDFFRGDIYKNDKNSEVQCLPSPIAKEEEQQENTKM